MKKYINKNNNNYYTERINEIKSKISDNPEALALLDTLSDELIKRDSKNSSMMWITFVGQDPSKSFIVIAKDEKEAILLTKQELEVDDNDQVDIVTIRIKEKVVSRSDLAN